MTDGSPVEIWIRLVREMPGTQLFFFASFMVVWLIGGNIVVARHYRRVGKPLRKMFSPFDFPFLRFNLREWLSLLAVAAVASAFMALGLLAGEPSA